jgi:hypothetical protein
MKYNSTVQVTSLYKFRDKLSVGKVASFMLQR